MITTLYTEEVSIADLDDYIERGVCFDLVSKVALLDKDRCDTDNSTGRYIRNKSADSVRESDTEEDDCEDGSF